MTQHSAIGKLVTCYLLGHAPRGLNQVVNPLQRKARILKYGVRKGPLQEKFAHLNELKSGLLPYDPPLIYKITGKFARCRFCFHRTKNKEKAKTVRMHMQFCIFVVLSKNRVSRKEPKLTRLNRIEHSQPYPLINSISIFKTFNPYRPTPNGISNSYQLEQSISVVTVNGVYFSFLLKL